ASRGWTASSTRSTWCPRTSAARSLSNRRPRDNPGRGGPPPRGPSGGSTMSADAAPMGAVEGVSRVDAEMAELVLLLPDAQAAARELAARRRGLTAAQLARRLIREFLSGSAQGAVRG